MMLEGEIGIRNIDSFYISLKEELESKTQVVLDFSNVTRIDASAAQVILSAWKQAIESGKVITLTGLSAYLKKLFKLAGLEKESLS